MLKEEVEEEQYNPHPGRLTPKPACILCHYHGVIMMDGNRKIDPATLPPEQTYCTAWQAFVPYLFACPLYRLQRPQPYWGGLGQYDKPRIPKSAWDFEASFWAWELWMEAHL